MASFPGTLVAEIIEIRFAFSGKVSFVSKKVGDTVKQWEAVASLDRKILQTELDQKLADYEKTRSQFELSKAKSYPGDNTGKFMQQIDQADLNISVKEVELSKIKLDQANLISPVNGVISDQGGLRVGMYVTPGSNPVKIIDLETLHFVFEIPQDKIEMFKESKAVEVKFPGFKEKFSGKTQVPFAGKDGKFQITVIFDKVEGLIPGLKGEVKI